MGTDRGCVSRAQADGATATRSTNDSGWHPMDPANGFAVARLAGGVGALADGVGPVQPMESGRHPDEDPGTPSPETATRSGVVVHRWDNGPSGAVRCRRREKNDPDEPDDHALGRSRGGFSTKIHLLCDGQGHPLHAVVTPGQAHESTALDVLLTEADQSLVDAEGDPVPWPVALAGDKGYRADWIDEYLLDLEVRPVIPSKTNEDCDARPVAFDAEAYRNRNIVERLIGWLKECRRVLTRFEKTAVNFVGMIRMAFIQRYLRLAAE